MEFEATEPLPPSGVVAARPVDFVDLTNPALTQRHYRRATEVGIKQPVKSASELSGSTAVPISFIHSVLRSGISPPQPELTMTGHRPIRLPRQWPKHVKAGVLHAISLASVVLTHARGRASRRCRLQAELEQATSGYCQVKVIGARPAHQR